MQKSNKFSVREMMEEDIPDIIGYWCKSRDEHLIAMGVDLKKMISPDEINVMLTTQLQQNFQEKKSYCLIWMFGNEAVGHCNINSILFGNSAHMHLHLWNDEKRKKGWGVQFVKLSLPYFFSNMNLQKLFCEPYALNPAPNKTLEKVGFSFVKTYTTTPGAINFEQEVCQWVMDREAVFGSIGNKV